MFFFVKILVKKIFSQDNKCYFCCQDIRGGRSRECAQISDAPRQGTRRDSRAGGAEGEGQGAEAEEDDDSQV